MNKKKKQNLIEQKINELKRVYYYSKQMSGGKRSREIEKKGYSYFKPKLDNIKTDFEYDIKSEISNLITKKDILNHFNSKKDLKDYYESLNLKELLVPKLMESNLSKKNNNEIVVDEDLNLINNENNCKSCLDLFGNIKDLTNDLNNNSSNIIEKITEYYKLLLKAYSFDYMTDPTISNHHRIQKLTNCYNKIINNECKINHYKKYNYFTIDYKNNLELINTIFN